MLLRIGDAVAQRCHAQHTATGADHIAVRIQCGAGMEHLGAARHVGQTADDIAHDRRFRVRLGREHYAQ
ncbi:hypothetical protein D3C81_1631990 [compost metagenome]